jgi:hypothetical protein
MENRLTHRLFVIEDKPIVKLLLKILCARSAIAKLICYEMPIARSR